MRGWCCLSLGLLGDGDGNFLKTKDDTQMINVKKIQQHMGIKRVTYQGFSKVKKMIKSLVYCVDSSWVPIDYSNSLSCKIRRRNYVYF